MQEFSLWKDEQETSTENHTSNIYIYNEDCEETLKRLIEEKRKVDIILTSPPYNTSGRCTTSEKARQNHQARYDIYVDQKTEQEYCDWLVKLFSMFDKVLSKNGVILWNVNYGATINNCNTMILSIAEILKHTDFVMSDKIVWKKKSALPNNVSKNKLTRITEDVFVFCRRSEYDTFEMNKQKTSVKDNGQCMYSVIYNFIEARNNDRATILNKATYSTEFCEKLLSIYGKEGMTVYDPFMGTGTTANACMLLGMNCIGSELSKAQCDYTKERLSLFWKDEKTVTNETSV